MAPLNFQVLKSLCMTLYTGKRFPAKDVTFYEKDSLPRRYQVCPVLGNVFPWLREVSLAVK